MPNLNRASKELYCRTPDECFASLAALAEHCRRQQETSHDVWVPPESLGTRPVDLNRLTLTAGNDGTYALKGAFDRIRQFLAIGVERLVRFHHPSSAL